MDSSTLDPNAIWGRLPMELVLQIVEEGIEDREIARALSHVCGWTRDMALPVLYTHLCPVADVRLLAEMPDHLKHYVCNVWVEDTPPPSTSALISRQTAWLWSTVSNMAISHQFLDACFDFFQADMEQSHRQYAPSCVTLTLFGSNLVRRWRQPTLCSKITHVRLIDDISMADLMLVSQMVALDHLAVSLDTRNVVDQMACVMALVNHYDQELRMVALVLSPRDDPAFWTSRVHTGINIHQSLYIVPGSHSKDGIRTEWEDSMKGGEDIWKKAAILRKAVLDGDDEGVAKIW